MPTSLEVDLIIGADGANSRVAKEIGAGEYDYAIAFQERIRIPDAQMEFEVEWFGASRPTTWVPEEAVRRVTKVREYCGANGLRAPGVTEWKAVESRRGRGGRGRGRGRGRNSSGGH